MSNNLPFLIIIGIIYVVVYIVRLSRKAKSSAPPAPPRPAVEEDFFVKDEEDETPFRRQAAEAAVTHAAPRAYVSEPPVFDAHDDSAKEAAASPAAEAEAPRVTAGGNSRTNRGFPQKLDTLPPLKRALVMAEILGKPKGM
jgi:hypothetical protein